MPEFIANYFLTSYKLCLSFLQFFINFLPTSYDLFQATYIPCLNFLHICYFYYKPLSSFWRHHKILISISLKFVITFLWFFTIFLQSLYEFLANFLWTSYKLHMNFLQTSYELLTNFTWTSYKHLNYFLQTSYELPVNLICSYRSAFCCSGHLIR